MHMALQSREWTLAEFDRLADDGNKYELLDGALLVTPSPSPAHERISVALHDILAPYVRAEGLGAVFTPRAAIRANGSEVEPDMMVRRTPPVVPDSWEDMPVPCLVIEILSHGTRWRDLHQKRAWYQRIGVADYWMVDRWDRSIRVARAGQDDQINHTLLAWHPIGASSSLVIDIPAFFTSALGHDHS